MSPDDHLYSNMFPSLGIHNLAEWIVGTLGWGFPKVQQPNKEN